MTAEQQRQLWVEGPDDFNLIRNLWRDTGHHPALFEIKYQHTESGAGVSGKAAILGKLKSNFLLGTSAIGLVLDADMSLRQTWEAAANPLRALSYAVPADPAPDGVILEAPSPGFPRVGIWMMPDNQSEGDLQGDLDAFASTLVHPDLALFQLAGQTLDQIEAGGLRRYRRRSKALIHTWLAWQEEPGKPLGLALSFKYLDASRPPAVSFISWLERLFPAP